MNTQTRELNPSMVRPATPPQIMQTVASQRELAEVYGGILMAKQDPRDPIAARDRIIMACTRPEFAETALYTYARGGTDITGPSIRMAETIALNWGNLWFGVRELEQRGDESTIEAYAIDLETNTRQNKIFQVKHVRYTRSGGRTSLDDPRDVYEAVAGQGARRLRACILGIVPSDVVDAAVHQVELTLKTKADVTPERIAGMLEKFGKFDVTRSMIEKRIQRRVDAITPALMVNLSKVYNSLKDGMSTVSEWFEVEEAKAVDEPPAVGVEGAKEALRKRRAPLGATETDLPISDAKAQPPEKAE